MLDLATLFPAPLLAAMLGDLGADVVTVEPENGDPLRRVGPQRDGDAVAWTVAARNKRSVVVDVAAARDLAAVADVVVVNQQQARLTRRGWDHASVRAGNPKVVYVSVSAFGATGPYADRPGNGSIAEAFGGLAHLTGDPGGPPVLASAAVGDTLAAISGVGRVLAALYSRDARSGGGAFVDVAMYEPVMELLATALASWPLGTEPPARAGSRVPGAVPRNVYRAADGNYVALSGPTDEQVERILDVIGRIAELDRWRRAAQRSGEEGDALDTAVAEWIAARPSADVVAAFLDARVPVAPVNDLAMLARDPHVRSRGSWDAATGAALRRAPAIGEHTDEVLAEWLHGPA